MRASTKRLDSSREAKRAIVFAVAWLTAMGALLASMGQQLERTGPPPSFEAIIAGPPTPIGGWLATFLEIAATFALVLQAALTYDRRARHVAAAGALLGVYTVLNLALVSSSLRLNTAAYTSIRNVCRDVMFYTAIAEAADGGLGWAVAELAMLIPICIVLSYTSAAFEEGGEYRFVLATSSNLSGLFIVYFVLSGLLRAGALHAAQRENARDARERWWYRSLILFYLLGWYSIFGYTAMVNNLGAFYANLYTGIVYNALLYSFSIMVLCFFLTLSRAKRLALERRVAAADKARIETEALMRGRQQYLGYIFHEARVPFSALVLGLDALAADSRIPNALLEDVALMRSSAADMQCVLNDTLDVEKMGSGMYVIKARPTVLALLLQRARRTMLPFAHREHVLVDMELDPALPRVAFLDADRLFQVIINLISNACKFSPHDGSGRIIVRLHAMPASTLANSAAAAACSLSPLRATEPSQSHAPSLDREMTRLEDAASALVVRAYARFCGSTRVAPPREDAPAQPAQASLPRITAPSMPLPPPLAMHEESPQATPLPAMSDHAAPCGWLMLEVYDNGQGISEAARSKLFLMFSQMEEGHLQVAKGSGLGLYICQQIVTRMGGTIGVESCLTAPAVVPKGSVFRVEVPLFAVPDGEASAGAVIAEAEAGYEDEAPTADEILEERVANARATMDRDAEGNFGSSSAAPSESVLVDVAAPLALQLEVAPPPRIVTPPHLIAAPRPFASPLPIGTSILVVDDDLPSRIFLSRTLSRMNPQCVVHVAENGLAALDAMAKRAYDVVCIDKQMPVMDGPTAVEQMRARGYHGVIIGVTGSLLEDEIAHFLASGAAAIIEKPVNLRKLQAKVRELLLDPSRQNA